ncbi:MAG TPA: mandelate racemase/muconate lactonizing enzyme family protein [Gammaproteobacteria bacterium]|nr:mandelate racemase/muconate lactonizing enzyme family protein [Gammaproteobacteria bacterium]
MRIAKLETLRADGGWRPFSFLKVSTDEGLTGWSEFLEGAWSPALPEVIAALGRSVVGADPRAFARIAAELAAVTEFTAGGLSRQAIAAIENACIDIAAKAAGVPACALFGGPLRTAVDVYWSHCGSFRAQHAELFERVLGLTPVRTLDDMERLGREAARRGFKAVKTNPMTFAGGTARLLNPGFVATGLEHGKTLDNATLAAIVAQVEALRGGLGAERGLMLDVNFAFRPAALRRLVTAVAPANPTWIEIDLRDANALAAVRARSNAPIASLESEYGVRAYRPFLAAQAVDVAVIDVLWNGFTDSLAIAALAAAHDVNVAPHNFSGPLGDLIAAHFCAVAGNAAIMEIEGDDVPWKPQLVTNAGTLVDGQFVLPAAAGWGAEVDEDAVRAHPWPRRT